MQSLIEWLFFLYDLPLFGCHTQQFCMALNHSIWLRCVVKTKHGPSEYWFLLCLEKQYCCRTMAQIYTPIVMESLMINFMNSACVLFDNSVLSFSPFVCIICLIQLFSDFPLCYALKLNLLVIHWGDAIFSHSQNEYMYYVMKPALLFTAMHFN